jgi:hypothetical protein
VRSSTFRRNVPPPCSRSNSNSTKNSTTYYLILSVFSPVWLNFRSWIWRPCFFPKFKELNPRRPNLHSYCRSYPETLYISSLLRGLITYVMCCYQAVSNGCALKFVLFNSRRQCDAFVYRSLVKSSVIWNRKSSPVGALCNRYPSRCCSRLLQTFDSTSPWRRLRHFQQIHSVYSSASCWAVGYYSELLGFWLALSNGPNRVGVSLPTPEEGKGQWCRSALSKGPNRVGVSLPLPEEGNRFSFQNVVFSII